MKETLTMKDDTLPGAASGDVLYQLLGDRPQKAGGHAGVDGHTLFVTRPVDCRVPAGSRAAEGRGVGGGQPAGEYLGWTWESAKAVLATMRRGTVSRGSEYWIQDRLLTDLGVDHVRIYNDFSPVRAFARVKRSASMRLVNLRRRGLL